LVFIGLSNKEEDQALKNDIRTRIFEQACRIPVSPFVVIMNAGNEP